MMMMIMLTTTATMTTTTLGPESIMAKHEVGRVEGRRRRVR
jgi:hypothetical protein